MNNKIEELEEFTSELSNSNRKYAFIKVLAKTKGITVYLDDYDVDYVIEALNKRLQDLKDDEDE